MALLWRDNRVVTLLSTNAQPDEEQTVLQRFQDRVVARKVMKGGSEKHAVQSVYFVY